MRGTLTLVVAVAVFGATGCSKNLSKDEAKKQLTESLQNGKPVYCPVRYDAVAVRTTNTYGPRMQTGVELHLDEGRACMNQLVDHGFATPGMGYENSKGDSLHAIWAKEPRAVLEKNLGSDSTATLLVACARYEVEQVSSVTTEGKRSTVTYEVKQVADPGIQALTSCQVRPPKVTATTREATFRQDDDGKWSLK